MNTYDEMVREVFDPRRFVADDHVERVTKVIYSAVAIDKPSPSDCEWVVDWND